MSYGFVIGKVTGLSYGPQNYTRLVYISTSWKRVVHLQKRKEREMTDQTTRWLTYKEELALAVFFSNVEKFKCLAGMPNYKVELLTEPMRIWNKNDAPLATILSCYKILYAVPGYEKLATKNDEIIAMVLKKSGLEITGNANLSEYNPDGLGNILRYKEYDALLKWVLSIRTLGYAPGKESWEQLKRKYRYIVIDALREQHLEKLGKLLPDWRKRQVIEELMQQNAEERRRYHNLPRPVLPVHVKEFIDMIDQPGAILALFDEGKLFYGYSDILEAIIRYTLTESKHITLRVGGYSYRVEGQALSLSCDLGNNPERLESIYCGYYPPNEDHSDARAIFHELDKYSFDYDDPFVRYSEDYDYKCFALGGVMHPMVYYYVNNIDTGWYDRDGKFCGFYDKQRGLQALGDVVMIRGYTDIKPATAAVFSDSGNHPGDQIFCGPAAHYEKRDRTSSQRKLFEDARIPYLNIGVKADY